MNDQPSEVIRTRISEIQLDGDGILRSTIVPNAEVTLEDSKRSIAVYRELSKGKARPVLMDARNIKSSDRESRVYATGKETASVVGAFAILVGGPVSKIVGNFFLRVNKPPYPTRLFTSEDEAIAWLRGFIK